MSVLLFRLNNVPEEEAEAVRALLHDEGLDFYETSAGMLGISTAAIWLRDKEQLPRAKRLIDDFQADHRESMRQAHRERVERGEADTFRSRLKREPLKIAIYLLAVVVILYISIVPWMSAWD